VSRGVSEREWRKWWDGNRHEIEAVLEAGDFDLIRRGRMEAAEMLLRREKIAWRSNVRIVTPIGAPSLSEHKLQQFEQARGVVLPADYRAFMLAWNGGYVWPGWFRAERSNALHTEPGERAILTLHAIDAAMIVPSAADTPGIPADLLPIACLNAPGSLVASDDVLVVGVAGDEAGRVWLWPGDDKDVERERLTPVAASFTALMDGLDYPVQGGPWMDHIDRGALTEFEKWMSTAGDVEARDPASGVTPIEYLALSRDFNLYLGDLWTDAEGKRRRQARLEMAKLLTNRGVHPGRAFYYAVAARTYEIAALFSVQLTSTEDLRQSWDRLQSAALPRHRWQPPPGPLRKEWNRRVVYEPELFARVEAELKARKKR
jgi:hypothetical protein